MIDSNSFKFDRPTLITLTAPTCSGKSYLLDALTYGPPGMPLEKEWVSPIERIVSTTTRPPRTGEVEGVTYFFITMEKSLEMERAGQFAELVEFRGTRYGVTHAEMEQKITSDRPPIVIVEPLGTEQYEHYCKKRGWDIFKIFVDTPEHIRLERLAERATKDIKEVIMKAATSGAVDAEKLRAGVNDNVDHFIDRYESITGDERSWRFNYNWDCVVDGTDLEGAIFDLVQHIRAWNGEKQYKMA